MYLKDYEMVYGEDDYAIALRKIKPLLADFKCSLHNKKPKYSFSYNDDGLYAEITPNCCFGSADLAFNIIKKSNLFHYINIVD